MRPTLIGLTMLASVLLAAGDDLLYVGSFGDAIYGFHLNKQGKLLPFGIVAETPMPGYLAIHPNGRFLYAANGSGDGAVSAFAIDRKTARLKFLNDQSSAGDGPWQGKAPGAGACHVVVDPSGSTLLLGNYGAGSIAAYPIGADGSLAAAAVRIQHQGSSVHPRFQAGPHANYISTDPGNRFALVCDPGTDKVMIYRFDAGRSFLTANDPPFATFRPGAGPGYLACHLKSQFAYVNNFLDSTLTALKFDKNRGVLEELQTLSTLPENFGGSNLTAEVQVHPSGRFAYVCNRGHASIAVFSIDQKSGKLAVIEHQPTQGSNPRNFAIDPKGEFLLAANNHSKSIVVFRINRQTGHLSPTGEKAEVRSPACIKFVAAR